MSPSRSSGEGGLAWAIGASGLAHGAALAILALTPSRFEGMATPPESYTVALVSPSSVGGTHFPGPPSERPESPPQVAPEAPRPAKPNTVVTEELPVAPVVAAEPAPKLPPPAKPPEPAEASKPDSLPAPEEKKPEASEEPSDTALAKPDEKEIEPPRPEEPKKVALKKEEPEAKPVAKKEKPPEAKPVAKKEEPAVKAVAKKEKPPEAKPVAKKEEPAVKAVAKKEQPAAKPVAKKEQPAGASATPNKAAKESTDLDKQIAAAVQRRAKAASGDSNQQGEVDRQIAAAVQRRTMDAARAASGIGSSDSAVAGVGPGSGVGGVLRGMEYVMYRNQMESRIKAAWVWAGADRTLRAVVRFNVTEEGKIINVKTVQASGDASYDASVERAIRAADPLGAPPERYRDEFGTVELEFRAEDARS